MQKSYIYRFLNKYNSTIYVGKTNNLDIRYKQHFTKGHLPKECYDSVAKIEYITENSELNALLLETYYINFFRPKYNQLNKTFKPTSLNNINLKNIKDNWKTYKTLNPIELYCEEEKTPNISRDLNFKEKVFFNLLTAISLAILLYNHFR